MDGNAPLSRNKALISIALAIGAVALWFGLAERGEPSRARPEPETEETPAPAAATAQEAHAELEHVDHHDDAAAPGAPHEHRPGDPSHPITPEHLRIYRENNFMHTIDNAIQIRDYQAIRRMNAEYKKEYPKDDYVVQDAYEMIADCLEEKTPERVARARAFWEKRRSSRARRDLRHICLE